MYKHQQCDMNHAHKRELTIRQLYRPSSMTNRDILKLKFSTLEMANYHSREELCQFHRVSQIIVKQQNPNQNFSTLSLSFHDSDISIICSRCDSATSFAIHPDKAVTMKTLHICHCKIMRPTPKMKDLTGHTEPTKYDCRKAAIRFAILKLKLPVVAYKTELPDWAGPSKAPQVSRDHLKLANGKWFSCDMKRLDLNNQSDHWEIQNFPKSKQEAFANAWGRMEMTGKQKKHNR